MNLRDLRRAMNERRRGLAPDQLQAASRAVAGRLWRLPVMARATGIGAYFAVAGEVDCTEIIGEAWERHRRVWLPVLQGARFHYAPYRQDSPLEENRYGIPEPVAGRRALREARCMDLVLVPLVAFDGSGNRLGMGGGYYDRSFSFRRNREHWRRPVLVGLAHEFQCVRRLPAKPWDVPLDFVVTEAAVHRF